MSWQSWGTSVYFPFSQGSFPKCFTEVQMLSQVQPDLLSSFSGSGFKVVYSNPQRLGLEKTYIPKPQMFLGHWTDILESCVLDHEKELVKDHGVINTNPLFLLGRMHITLQGGPQCLCLLPSNGGRGRRTEGKCHFREACVCERHTCFLYCLGRVNQCWDIVQEQTRSIRSRNWLSFPQGHWVPAYPWA